MASHEPISVVIPAHNEAGVIARCLEALTSGAADGELDVIVVCNGCKDATADVARRFAPHVRVIETATPSKGNALNLGDDAARSFPRFYVDADVVMPLGAVRDVARALRNGQALTAAPRLAVDVSRSGWMVRAFYDVWLRTPYMKRGMVGSGVYAVSAEGRRRFARFPDLTADDAFVRLHFRPEERKVVETGTFTITAPATLRALIKIKTRGHFGNYELRAQIPALWEGPGEGHGAALLGMARNPARWPAIAVYVFVRVVSRLLSYRRYYFGNHRHWERDDSSRAPGNATAAPSSSSRPLDGPERGPGPVSDPRVALVPAPAGVISKELVEST